MQKAIISLLFVLLGVFSSPLEAALPNFKAGSVILDDETDAAFQKWVNKIFAVAGLKNYHPHIYIIVNAEVNAAAALGGNIFIFSEFLTNCDNASQFLGVMAHEVGHIAGGHVSRIDAASHQALVPAAAALLLGGALTLVTGDPTPLTAGLAGGSHLFERGMLKFSRTQECSADQAGLSYLEKLGWPPEGLAEFLDKISKLQGSSLKMDPYSMTHPLTPDRIEAVHAHLRKHPHTKRAIPPEMEATFQRIKAKMMAFLNPQKALATYKEGDTSLPARYARAIALYRQGQFAMSLNHIEALLKSHPQDPYFYELKGQVLFEKGDIEATVPALQTAHKLRPHSPLITIMLAHALIESRSTSGGTALAIKLLSPLTQKHPQDYPMAWRLLATAYGKSGQVGEAALALAEEAFLSGNYKLAASQANRAKSLLKCNPKALTRAEDLCRQIKYAASSG
jgi:predicted Zn-dependent protease